MHVPSAAGGPSITQGSYGERGNLELAYPDPRDGLWVCWFNNDEAAAGEVAAETWSGGLHFACGRRYHAVSLIQAASGPQFLELLAAGDDGLHRWTWSPGRGFEHTDVLPGRPGELLDDCVIAEVGERLVACARRGDELLVWRAGLSAYPTLQWSGPSRADLPAETTRLAARPDADGSVWAAVVVDAGLLVTTDPTSVAWRRVGESVGPVTAACWVADLPAGISRDPVLVVAASDRVCSVSLDVDAEPVVLATGPTADSLTAAWSRAGTDHLEVVARCGDDLIHLRR